MNVLMSNELLGGSKIMKLAEQEAEIGVEMDD
jgi:hypothetical protein